VFFGRLRPLGTAWNRLGPLAPAWARLRRPLAPAFHKRPRHTAQLRLAALKLSSFTGVPVVM